MGIDDILRTINIVLALCWFVYMCSLYSWWVTRPREERIVLSSIPLLIALVIISSAEAILQDVGPGVRMFLYTPALILCIYGVHMLSRKIKKYISRREED